MDSLDYLLALEEIKKLKHRYLRCVDLRKWDELADTLTEDAVAYYGTHATGGPARMEGRQATLDYLRKNMGPDVITEHVAGHPEIEVDGDSASGTWCFTDTVYAKSYGVIINGFAYYHDEYRRCPDGVWRIAHTSYERIYETLTSMKDLPSLRFLANRWAAQENEE